MTSIPSLKCEVDEDCENNEAGIANCLPYPEKNTTIRYCLCHNNYFMTNDYNCTKPTEIDSTEFTHVSQTTLPTPTRGPSSGSTEFTSIEIASFAILFLLIFALIFKIFTKFFHNIKKFRHARRVNDRIQTPIEDVEENKPKSISLQMDNSLYMASREPTVPDSLTIGEDQSPKYSEDPTSYSFHCENNPLLAPRLNRNSITDLKKIGEGHFGLVFKGCWRLQLPALFEDEDDCYQEQEVAVKMLKQNVTPEAEIDFWREVYIMSSFRHPNILPLLGVCPRENSDPPCMVFEFMEYGDLTKVLQNNTSQFWNSIPGLPILSPQDLLSIAHQIANGMNFLSAQRYVHRDLACRNCLVGTNGKGLEVKISDFGLSRDVYISDYYTRIFCTIRQLGHYQKMLPIRWMSPESIAFGKFTIESDIWSYGVVLWEIFSYAKQPYYGYTSEQALQLILDGNILSIPNNCPREVADIMMLCWKKKSKDRIRFPEICRRFSDLRGSLENTNEIISHDDGYLLSMCQIPSSST